METVKLNHKKIILVIFTILFSISILGCTLENNLNSNDYNIFISDETIEKKIEEIRENLNYVTIDNISYNFLNALVAIEDKRFYEHGGVDTIAIIRSTVANIKARDIVQGGSTITQQLAKNLFLDNNQDILRKVSEMVISIKLEKLYTKEEILELYSNVVYFGNEYYGINNAARGYFNSLPKDLTLNQGSLLAGLLQSPTNYNPKKYLARAKNRQEQVLSAMVKEKYITEEQRDNIIE